MNSAMPQAQLPLFDHLTTLITAELTFACREGTVYYFNGQLPVFSHAQGDLASFRLFTSRLIVYGTATQGQIVKGFGVSLTTVKRAVKSLRERNNWPPVIEKVAGIEPLAGGGLSGGGGA